MFCKQNDHILELQLPPSQAVDFGMQNPCCLRDAIVHEAPP
jgi:hypothetical protein